MAPPDLAVLVAVVRVTAVSDTMVQLDPVREALGRVAGEVCSMLESAPDGDVSVPGSEWTVADVAAHLALGTEAYIGYVGGGTDPFVDVSDIAGGSLTGTNATRLGAEPERHLPALVSRLRAAASTLLDATAGRNRDELVSWNGQPLALADMLGIGLGEYVLHGRDIARALGRRWDIRRDDARLILAAALPLLPLLVDPTATAGVRARYDLRVRGGTRVVVTIQEGELAVSHDREPVDCHVSADPVALLLVAYGRRTQWVPILTGKLLAWGRKPWLGLRLVRYLVAP
jgi:uncharacterized protein (TIGR03083 family)